MKKFRTVVSVIMLGALVALPLSAAASTSDDMYLAMLRALDGPVEVQPKVTATSTASTTAPAAAKPAAAKSFSTAVPQPKDAVLSPGYLFNLDGNAPPRDEQADGLQATLALLVAQFAALSSQKSQATSTASTTPAATSTQPAPKKVFIRNLDVGARGADVSALQRILIDGSYMVGEPTGYFGILTKTAVMALQSDEGLDQTGHVGPKTRGILNTGDTKRFVHVQPIVMLPPTKSAKVYFSFVAPTIPQSSGSTFASTSNSTGTIATSTSSTSASSTATSTPPLPPGPVSVSLIVSPTDVPDGGVSLATWSSINATACGASGDWEGSLPAYGTVKVGPIHATVDLILTCVGPGGQDSTTATIVAGAQQ